MNGAIVLCGGRSSRMGRPKALLPWNGVPMVSHIVGVLEEVVSDIVVVASEDLELPPLAARVVYDREPYLGPLAGLAAGLDALRADAAFVTATDTPYLDAALVHTLLEAGPTVAVESEGFVQPLVSVLPRNAARHAHALLSAGERRPLRLLEALDFRRLDMATIGDAARLESLNTPDEYLAALRRQYPAAKASVEFLGRSRLRTGVRERSVPVGTLAEVLAHAAPELPLVEDGELAKHFLVSIEARRFVRDPALPVGDDERVIVMDAAVGG